MLALRSAAVRPQHKRDKQDECAADATTNLKHASSLYQVILNRFLFPLLEQLGVDQKAEPESLQGPKDEALPSIQETQTQKIPVEKKRVGANEQRSVIVEAAQKSFALQRISPQARLDVNRIQRLHLLHHLCIGPSVMPGRPL